MAFQLGIVSYYYYLKDDKFWLLFTILLGAFTFPTFIYLGAIFFLLPYRTKIPLNKSVEPFNWALIVLLLLLYRLFLFC